MSMPKAQRKVRAVSVRCGHRVAQECTPSCVGLVRPGAPVPAAKRDATPTIARQHKRQDALVAQALREMRTEPRLPKRAPSTIEERLAFARNRRAEGHGDDVGRWWGNLPHLDKPTPTPLMGEFARRKQVAVRVGYEAHMPTVWHALADSGRSIRCDSTTEIPVSQTHHVMVALVRDPAKPLDDGKLTARDLVPVVTCTMCRVRLIAKLMEAGLYSGL